MGQRHSDNAVACLGVGDGPFDVVENYLDDGFRLEMEKTAGVSIGEGRGSVTTPQMVAQSSFPLEDAIDHDPSDSRVKWPPTSATVSMLTYYKNSDEQYHECT